MENSESGVTPPVFEQSVLTPEEKMLAAVGYVGFLCLLPLLLRPDSQYCRFHGKQGLAWAIIYFFLPFLLSFLPFFILTFIVNITFYGCILFCILQAWSGKQFSFPVISDLAKSIPL